MSSRRPRATGRFEEIGERVRKDGSRFLADVVITAIRAPDGSLAASARSPATSPSALAADDRGEGQRDQARAA